MAYSSIGCMVVLHQSRRLRLKQDGKSYKIEKIGMTRWKYSIDETKSLSRQLLTSTIKCKRCSRYGIPVESKHKRTADDAADASLKQIRVIDWQFLQFYTTGDQNRNKVLLMCLLLPLNTTTQSQYYDNCIIASGKSLSPSFDAQVKVRSTAYSESTYSNAIRERWIVIDLKHHIQQVDFAQATWSCRVHSNN